MRIIFLAEPQDRV